MLLCSSWASSLLGEVFPKRSLDTVVGREQPGRRWNSSMDFQLLTFEQTACAGSYPFNNLLLLGSADPMDVVVGQGISTLFCPLHSKPVHFPSCYAQIEVPSKSDK